MPRVVLFDIDNTLLYSGGAGSFAMNAAFNELFGVSDGFGRVEFSGRTDLFILQGGLAEHGIAGGAEEHLAAFTSRYYGLLPDALAQREGYLMPGFPELLSALRNVGVRLGLATGNFGEAAGIKLQYYGIAGFFEGGGFGEVSLDRAEVVAAAIRAVGNGARPADIVVVGDTPHDVTSALANGVVGVGVATGKFTVEELRDSGAALVYQDFADWQTVVRELAGD
ncbi:MAG TPA: HAD family hydrolase [Dehalococcoidia bacterium]|jgi:phosphoglycolate phosphatase-like HAD superfamily hydrolase